MQVGLFGRPTAVNNVETLVAVLDIVRDGAESYAAVGTAGSTGTRLFFVSGAVVAGSVPVRHSPANFLMSFSCFASDCCSAFADVAMSAREPDFSAVWKPASLPASSLSPAAPSSM